MSTYVVSSFLAGHLDVPTRNDLFAPCPDFDWKDFDAPSQTNRSQITESDLAQLFHDGTHLLARSHAAKELKEQTGYGQSACYSALKLDGRFATNLGQLISCVDAVLIIIGDSGILGVCRQFSVI